MFTLKRDVEVLMLSTSECELIGERVSGGEFG